MLKTAEKKQSHFSYKHLSVHFYSVTNTFLLMSDLILSETKKLYSVNRQLLTSLLEARENGCTYVVSDISSDGSEPYEFEYKVDSFMVGIFCNEVKCNEFEVNVNTVSEDFGAFNVFMAEQDDISKRMFEGVCSALRCNFSGNGMFTDMGLPSGRLWASKAVGADCGSQPGKIYHNGTTKVVGESSSNNQNNCSYAHQFTSYDVEDPATLLWGCNWRLPSIDDFEELSVNCIFSHNTNLLGTGIEGEVFISKINGNVLFFPTTQKCSSYSIGAPKSRVREKMSTATLSASGVKLETNKSIINANWDSPCYIRPVRKED